MSEKEKRYEEILLKGKPDKNWTSADVDKYSEALNQWWNKLPIDGLDIFDPQENK